MASRSGLKTQIVKYTIPSTASATPFTNGGVPITYLDAGRWIAFVSYAIDPVNAGANLSLVSYALTTTAVLGGIGAVGIVQHVQSASTGADVNNKSTNGNMFLISADNTPIFFSITATTSAGNYITSSVALDALSSQISFVKIE